MYFAQKHLILVQKNRLRIWGYPRPPFYGFFSAKRGLWIWGGPPPPFQDKIRKVVFEGLPKPITNKNIICQHYLMNTNINLFKNIKEYE